MRLFVAVTLPRGLRETLWRDTAVLRKAELPVRWVKPEGYHVTLKFLGDVDGERHDELARVLADAARPSPQFRLSLSGLGAFPDVRRPRVLWAGLREDPALASLHRRVDDGLADLGFEREGRPFHGHVTLGRAKREARRDAFGALESLMATTQTGGEFAVEAIELIESRLGPDGATYGTVGRFVLGDA